MPVPTAAAKSTKAAIMKLSMAKRWRFVAPTAPNHIKNAKNNQGKQNYDYHETAPFLAVTIKMSDVEADKYFADLETGNDIYNKRMLWWDTAPDAYKRAIQEDPEDVNAVRITFLKPIQYDELTSIGFNKPLEGSAEVPFTPRYDLGE